MFNFIILTYLFFKFQQISGDLILQKSKNTVSNQVFRIKLLNEYKVKALGRQQPLEDLTCDELVKLLKFFFQC